MKKLQLLLLVFIYSFQETQAQRANKEEENPAERSRFEYNMTKDPKTGLIPRNELEKSREIMTKMLKLMAPVPNINWAERGPNNVGGRTRALMWDPNDPLKLKAWAGGVAGGLWYNNNVINNESPWYKVNDFWDNIAIADIAYDPSNTQIFYVATGERGASGKTDNFGGSGTGGGGIWKTTDGGITWKRLASTLPDYTQNNDAAGWRVVPRILVNNQGHVFVANYWGVLRSTNGGEKWDYLTGTNAPPNSNPERITDIELGTDGILYIGEGGNFSPKIYKSTDNTVSAFTVITPIDTAKTGRVDIVLDKGSSGANQVLYAVAASSDKTGVRFFSRSNNAGQTWTNVTVPMDVDGAPGTPFTAQQGDYNLILGLKPTDPNTIYAGGTTAAISYTGGVSVGGAPAWKHEFGTNYFYAPSNKFFVDNHAFAARPGFPDGAIFGNDGGVFFSTEWGNPNVEKNFQRRTGGYNVTQFYSVAIAGQANSGLIMGGAQDNGTQVVNSPYGTQGKGFEIQGGDGGLSFIDQEDPNLLISSYINVSYKLHTNGPASQANIDLLPQDKSRGNFINQADYDSPNNTLYANYSASGEVKLIRYTISGTAPNYTSVSSILTFDKSFGISVIKLGKTSGNIYLGTDKGQVYKATAVPQTGDQSVSLTLVMDTLNTSKGYVSSIDFGGSEDTLVVVKSNYNIKSVYYTNNSGTDWISKDDDGYGLPNVPIRYVLVNPKNTKQVLLATELGVWSTSNITADNPQWAATNASLANVRCDMLRYRASDNTVAVATHGRGFFTTKLTQNFPCPITKVLISTTDDKSTGATTFQASETITASNKITGNASVTLTAGKSIELKPSTTGGGTTFEAANGTVFHAYIQGCTN
jgi:hypothetical protein